MYHKTLLSPLKLTDTLILKNRMIKSPQSTMYWDDDYFMSDRVIDFYESIAQGGVGLLILAGILWYPAHPGGIYGALYDDKYLPGMKKFVERMHRHNCPVFCQFHHTGPSSPSDDKGGRPFGPSRLEQEDMASPLPYLHATRELSLEEIEEHKRRYVDAAVRAREAGFDGVEVHGAHGYFLASFLSRVWNRRTDQYGIQSFESRTRLMVEIMEGIRERCGEDFPIGVRINGEEYGAKGAMTLEESREIAKILEKAGACYISVSGYGFGPLPMTYVPDYFPYPEPEDHMKPYMDRYRGDGVYACSAEEIRKVVNVPVVAVGRMDEDKAERILSQGKADLIALGRTLWADPEFPNKVRDGRIEDIVRCTRCATCEDPPRGARRCRVNPSMGRERELNIEPARKFKKVMVIGGVPAGREAARVASLRGHAVTLVEKDSRLGGRLFLASMIKGSDVEDVKPVISYLTRQVTERSGINIRLNTAGTVELIAGERPDAVIVATGGTYALPDIPGIQRWNVQGVKTMSKLAALPLRILGPDRLNELSRLAMPIGSRITIVGGQIEGIQGAVFLKKRGKDVAVLEASDHIGEGIPPRYMERAAAWLRKNDVSISTGITLRAIDKGGVHYLDAQGRECCRESDFVLVLTRQTPDHSLADSIRNLVPEVHVIGSANGAASSLIVHAIAEGRTVGVQL